MGACCKPRKLRNGPYCVRRIESHACIGTTAASGAWPALASGSSDGRSDRYGNSGSASSTHPRKRASTFCQRPQRFAYTSSLYRQNLRSRVRVTMPPALRKASRIASNSRSSAMRLRSSAFKPAARTSSFQESKCFRTWCSLIPVSRAHVVRETDSASSRSASCCNEAISSSRVCVGVPTSRQYL